jgi:15-cis-phytoene synthase
MTANAAADAAYCAALVRESDFDRYAAALFALPERRAQLLSLYAFNAEIARVREQVTQALAGEIRLQWWIDVLSGKSAGDAQANPVAAQLLQTVEACGLSRASLSELVEAHRFDLYDEPMQTAAEVEGFLDQTAGKLFLLGARILSAGAPIERSPLLEALTHHASLAHGLISLVEALPRHAARRQLYVPLEQLAEFGVSSDAVFGGGPSLELTRLVRSLADEAAREFGEAMKLMPGIDREMRASFLLLALVPARLKRLDRDGFDPFRLRPLSRLSRLWTLRRAARAFRRL